MSAFQTYLYSTEGKERVDHLVEIVTMLDYYNMNEFLRDNPGCVEAMFNWINKNSTSEWNEIFEWNTEVEEDFEEDEE